MSKRPNLGFRCNKPVIPNDRYLAKILKNNSHKKVKKFINKVRPPRRPANSRQLASLVSGNAAQCNELRYLAG